MFGAVLGQQCAAKPNIYKRPSGRMHSTSPARNKVGLHSFQETR